MQRGNAVGHTTHTRSHERMLLSRTDCLCESLEVAKKYFGLGYAYIISQA